MVAAALALDAMDHYLQSWIIVISVTVYNSLNTVVMMTEALRISAFTNHWECSSEQPLSQRCK
jgi:hypothetical protein